MREIIPINGEWKFADHFRTEYSTADFDDSDFLPIDVPHTNKELPYNYFDERDYMFVSCYRRQLKIPARHAGKNVHIDFEGVMAYAQVYVNGRFVGEHKGGYTPFSFDLTDYLDFNQTNMLAVMVDSSERKDIPPFGRVVDYLTFGGIYREVRLRIVGDVFIENVFARPGGIMDEQKSLDVTMHIINKNKTRQEINLALKLIKDGCEIAKTNVAAAIDGACKSSIEAVFTQLANIELWDVDSPQLYELEVNLHAEDEPVDSYDVRIGFRDAWTKEDGFYLNGRKIKIRGLNRHQFYPYVGYAMPERVQKKDADILKYELGLNAVRTSHYPQSRHFLDRCDEIGLLVLEEMPGWQHIGDQEWKQVALANLAEMIERDWNHPSVILWGVRINES